MSALANVEPHPALVLDQCEDYWSRVREAYNHDEDFKTFLRVRNQRAEWLRKLHKAQAMVDHFNGCLEVARAKVKPELRGLLP